MTLRRNTQRTAGLLCALWASIACHAQTAPTAELTAPPISKNSIAAIVENKVITMDEVRDELSLELEALKQRVIEAGGTQKDMNDLVLKRVTAIIQNFIDRELVIKEFRKVKEGQPVRQIPATFIDARISAELIERFDNDRSKFLTWLGNRHLTKDEYRNEIEEDIIFSYMRSTQRKSMSLVSPVKIETYYKEHTEEFRRPDRVHMRLIQLNRAEGETDEQLKARGMELAVKARSGTKFEDLAREHSQDPTSKAKGGDWSWVEPNVLATEFIQPLFALKKGELTDPIVRGNNAFLLYAEEREYEGIEPIEKARPEIEEKLIQIMGAQEENKWLERLRRQGFFRILFTGE